MTNKLYVGNLAYSVNDAQLSQMFSEAGEVASATVITDKYSGRSKGFGFVEMKDEESSQKAMEMFNGKEIDGRPIVVNEARPQKPRN